MTSSLKAMRSREAAQRIIQARIDTGVAPKRVTEKRPSQTFASEKRPTKT